MAIWHGQKRYVKEGEPPVESPDPKLIKRTLPDQCDCGRSAMACEAIETTWATRCCGFCFHPGRDASEDGIRRTIAMGGPT